MRPGTGSTIFVGISSGTPLSHKQVFFVTGCPNQNGCTICVYGGRQKTLLGTGFSTTTFGYLPTRILKIGLAPVFRASPFQAEADVHAISASHLHLSGKYMEDEQSVNPNILQNADHRFGYETAPPQEGCSIAHDVPLRMPS